MKRRRELFNEDGSSAGWEEYYDYIFPDEEVTAPHLKLLAMAHKWKQQKAADTSSAVDTAAPVASE